MKMQEVLMKKKEVSTKREKFLMKKRWCKTVILRGGKDSDVDGVVYKEGENVGKEGKMRNSEDFGLEHVTNMQEELSIIDSMSLSD